MKLKPILAFLLMGTSLLSFGQVDELTPEEQAYSDSITALNLENETIANSQEAYNKGIELFSAKKFDQAIKEFGISVKLDPNFTAAYYNKGVAENEVSSFSNAVKTLNKLIELKPNYSKAFFQRGRSFQGLNEYVKAENDYDASLKLDSKNAKAYYN